MRLPNGQHAVVPIEKLVEYVLSPDHPRGKHKARVFLRVFGFTAAHADLLRGELLRAAAESDDAREGRTDAFGVRHELDVRLTGPAGSGIVRSIWLIPAGGLEPVLVTCFVL